MEQHDTIEGIKSLVRLVNDLQEQFLTEDILFSNIQDQIGNQLLHATLCDSTFWGQVKNDNIWLDKDWHKHSRNKQIFDSSFLSILQQRIIDNTRKKTAKIVYPTSYLDNKLDDSLYNYLIYSFFSEEQNTAYFIGLVNVKEDIQELDHQLFDFFESLSFLLKVHFRIEKIVSRSNETKNISRAISQKESLEIHKTELIAQNEELLRRQFELGKLKDEYEELFEFSPIPYFELNHLGEILKVNDSGSFLIREGKRNLKNIPFSRLVKSKYQKVFSKHLVDTFMNNELNECELELNLSLENYSYVRLYSRPFKKYSKGRFTTLTAVIDLTLTQIQKIKIEKQKRQLSTHSVILENVRDGLMIIDLEGHITYFNRGAEKITNYFEDELIWESPDKIFFEKDFPSSKEDVQRMFNGDQFQGIWKGLTKDGKEIWLDTNTSFFEDGDGQIQGIIASFRDVTQFKENQEKLVQRERFLMQGSEMAKMGWWFWNEEKGEHGVWSPQLLKLYGLEEGESPWNYNDWLHNFIYPEDKDRVASIIENAIENDHDGYKITYRFIKKNTGDIHYMKSWVNFKRDATGKVVQWFGNTQDITEEEQRAAELAQQKELLQAIVDKLPFYVAAHTRQGYPIFANKTAYKYAGDLVMGLHIEELLAKSYSFEDRNRAYQLHLQADGKWHYFQSKLVNGQMRDMNWMNIGVSDGTIVSLGEDITERLNAERKLIEQDIFLNTVINNLTVGLQVFDEKGISFRMNEAQRKLLGLPSIDYGIGSYNILDDNVIPSSLKQKIEAVFQGKLFLNEKFVYDLTPYKDMWDINVDEKYLSCSMYPIIIEDKIKFVIQLCQDITEQMRYEKTLELQNSELRKVNYELDSFVYQVSHDLRSPISSSLGLIELGLMEDDISEIKKGLMMQKRAMLRQDEFIKKILDHSYNARKEIDWQEVKLHKLIEDVKEDMLLPPEEFSMIINDVEDAVLINTDPFRLKVVLFNLISNGLKFKKIGNDKHYVKISMSLMDTKLIIDISDNGIGIPKAYIDKVFDMFYRATDQNHGTGIGLYLVKETVKMISGKIVVESEEKVGTTFKITLPNINWFNNKINSINDLNQ